MERAALLRGSLSLYLACVPGAAFWLLEAEGCDPCTCPLPRLAFGSGINHPVTPSTPSPSNPPGRSPGLDTGPCWPGLLLLPGMVAGPYLETCALGTCGVGPFTPRQVHQADFAHLKEQAYQMQEPVQLLQGQAVHQGRPPGATTTSLPRVHRLVPCTAL
jgi:hypothetical protein